MLDIKVKYFNKEIDKIAKIAVGDWIDLRAAETIEMKAGERKLIPLGVAMKLPEGYEAWIAPRSSTFKNYGITVVNSIGIVDESYCGNDDQWFLNALAHKDTTIPKNNRICQFRIMQKMPSVNIIEVDEMEDENRGGHGSTGVK